MRPTVFFRKRIDSNRLSRTPDDTEEYALPFNGWHFEKKNFSLYSTIGTENSNSKRSTRQKQKKQKEFISSKKEDLIKFTAFGYGQSPALFDVSILIEHLHRKYFTWLCYAGARIDIDHEKSEQIKISSPINVLKTQQMMR